MESPTTPSSSRSGFYRSLFWSALIDAFCPYLVYRLVSPHTSVPAALCWTMAPPAASNLLMLIRKRSLDMVGVIVIAGTGAGLLLFLLGGSARLLLIRESFITGAVGLLFLVSLLFRRPFCFYISRQFITNNNPARVANWDSQYERSLYKFGMPLMTVVWGMVLCGEAGLRAALAFSLPVATFLAMYNFIFLGVYAVAMAWSYSYGWRTYKKEAFADAPAK